MKHSEANMPNHLLMPAIRLKASGKMRQKMVLRKRHAIPSLSKAVRRKCLECVCGSAHEVRMCHISECPLWPYRFGRSPNEDDLKVPVYDKHGSLEGYCDYEGYPQEVAGAGGQT